MSGIWVEPSSMADDYDPPCSLNPPEPTEITRLRRQLVDLAEERDLLVRQLVAIRTMAAAEPFNIDELRRILDGRGS